MLDKYIKVIDEIKEEIFFIEDAKGDFIMGKDFMRFRFKTNDNLPYNQIINVPVCVISKRILFEEKIGIIHGLNCKIVFMKAVKIDCFYLLRLFLLKN